MSLILVIEEEKDDCALIQRVLNRKGHRVETFLSERGVVQWLGHYKPDLAIVSAGKQGERAGEMVSLLLLSGLDRSQIILRANPASLSAVRMAFQDKVREILVKPWEMERLEKIGALENHPEETP